MREKLKQMLLEKSFKYSDTPIFKLVSGSMSKFYVNCKPTILSAYGMFLTGSLVFKEIEDIIDQIAGVGGLTFGADPIANATSMISYFKEKPINSFSIRKKEKDHGIIKLVEGDMKQGDKVVILEDVTTTGGSAIKAINSAQSEGLDVIRVITLIDRQEMNGLENIKALIPDARAIFNVDELITAYKKLQSKS